MARRDFFFDPEAPKPNSIRPATAVALLNSVVYAAEIESGDLKIDDESKEASWVSLTSAVELPLAESQRRRLKDVLEYQKHRQRFLSNVDFPDFLFAFAIEPKIPTRAV